MKTIKEQYPTISNEASILIVGVKPVIFEHIKSGFQNILYLPLNRRWIIRLISNVLRVLNKDNKVDLTLRSALEYTKYNYVYIQKFDCLNTRVVMMEVSDIDIGFGRPEFGTDRDVSYFRILMGKQICKAV